MAVIKVEPIPIGLFEALSNQWRTINQYVVKQTCIVPRTGRFEDGSYSQRNKMEKGKIVYARWDETFPNLIELEYPSMQYSVIFMFTLQQWKNLVKPNLLLIEKEKKTKTLSS